MIKHHHQIVRVWEFIHSDRSMWRQSTDWRHPCRSTFHSHVGCHVADCKIQLYNGRSSHPQHFPACEKDRGKTKRERRRQKVYELPSNWRYEHKACYCSVNVLQIMMTRLERLTQSTCHYLSAHSLSVCVTMWKSVPCICMVLHMGHCWCFLPHCSYSADRKGSLYNRQHTWK